MEEVGLVGQLVFMCDDNNSFAIQVVFGYHLANLMVWGMRLAFVMWGYPCLPIVWSRLGLANTIFSHFLVKSGIV